MPLFGSIALIALGLATAGFGFWAAGRPSRGLVVAGNVAAPVGVVTALIGTVLVALPNFFGA